MGSYFGTDGIRGIAGEKLTLELAHKVAVALAELLKDGAERPLVVIGEDTRISCAMLCDAMSAALMGDGCDVIKLEVIPIYKTMSWKSIVQLFSFLSALTERPK